MKGTYVILLECPENCKLSIGSLGEVSFKKGYYAYVGSAMNNLEKRLKRHLSKDKKVFWHIDYLTTSENFIIRKVFIKISNRKEEDKVAEILEKEFSYISKFGSSDSKNKSHLFIIKKVDDLIKILKNLGFMELNMKSFAAAEE